MCMFECASVSVKGMRIDVYTYLVENTCSKYALINVNYRPVINKKTLVAFQGKCLNFRRRINLV